MGNGNSKPTSEQSQHVFAADAPVRFSNELVDSLQNSNQSDSTRSKTLELQIQSRVTSELEKLQAQESAKLAQLSESLSDETSTPAEPSLVEKIGDTLSSSATLAEKQRQQEMSRNSVSKEIAELKKKLESRKKLDEVDTAVSKAKDDVVTCLRANDRRPLDCWKEVAAFKAEVGKLEKEFVEKTVR
ncbi:DUF1690-domain-containing protein [Mytilinidion resinicola]|uniref:DUF1690-domain-containing protein n=1 Tax=Mytilinidion resinicola TaxID=574789 RepID=A0A6A6YMC0_9PEZI|nr:DUF1690-domain-containing protein [Mytilinidion resinicola]KAF2810026.1 DUF1690-domain-containing protein [Mytilinidion resinicola]